MSPSSAFLALHTVVLRNASNFAFKKRKRNVTGNKNTHFLQHLHPFAKRRLQNVAS